MQQTVCTRLWVPALLCLIVRTSGFDIAWKLRNCYDSTVVILNFSINGFIFGWRWISAVLRGRNEKKVLLLCLFKLASSVCLVGMTSPQSEPPSESKYSGISFVTYSFHSPRRRTNLKTDNFKRRDLRCGAWRQWTWRAVHTNSMRTIVVCTFVSTIVWLNFATVSLDTGSNSGGIILPLVRVCIPSFGYWIIWILDSDKIILACSRA